MTIPASTVPLAVGYLYDTIKAAVNDPAVLVSYGPPALNHPDDMIIIEGISREITPLQMVGSGGAGWLDESYVVEVNVWVYRGGADARTVLERASALADIVVAAVRTDPSLGGAVVVAHPERVDYTQSWNDDHTGRLVEALVGIRCRTRI